MRILRELAALVSVPIVILIGLMWRPKWICKWGQWVGNVIWDDK